MFDDITSFSGEYRWLSNFAPVDIIYEGIKYPSVEHAYQAAKLPAGTRRDQSGRWEIAKLPTPGAAKRAGQKIELQNWWTPDYRIKVMRILLYKKFQPYGRNVPEGEVFNPYFLKLAQTGDRHIEEGNTWGDTFWGTCDRKGANHLGKLIMEIREHNKVNYCTNPQ